MSGAVQLLKRVVMIPLVLGIQCVIIVGSPILFLVAAVVSLARRSSRAWRSVALLVGFALIELKTVATVAREFGDADQLIRQVIGDCSGLMIRALKVPIVIEDGSASIESVAGSDGVVVLARHCGPGDSIYIAWLLAVHYRLSLRVVLKKTLRLEPAIDLAGDRLPFCFVGADSEQATEDIKVLSASLRPGQALLLFPEGGNFTWKRWRSGLRYLASNGDFAAARRAAGRTHTLPPRSGGTLAALQAAPHADVLLVTHSGFSDDGRDRKWWRLPVERDFLIRTIRYPAAEVPRDEAGATAFVEDAWAQVDTWVEAYADLNTPDQPLDDSAPIED